MAAPDLVALIGQLTDRLQLDPWTTTGELISAPSLSFMENVQNTRPTSADFRWRDVEPLLQQASALLDRALSDRAALQTAGEKYATFTVDFKRRLELVQIADAEQADLRYETPYLVSSSQRNAADQTVSALQNQWTNYNKALTTFSTRRGDLESNSNALEYLGLCSDGGSTRTWPTATYGTFGYVTPPGMGTNRCDIGSYVSSIIQSIRSDIEQSERSAELNAIEALHNPAIQNAAAAAAQEHWDGANRQHLADRANVEKEAVTLLASMACVKWLLDFRQQMLSIAPRYLQSIVDAYERLISVDLGMRNVYGLVDAASPTGPLPALVDEPSVDLIILWVRKAATWLAALTQQSQNYTLSVSTRAQMGQPVLTLGDGNNPRSWQFTLGPELFTGQCYVRVRGLAVYVSGAADSLWLVNVTLPNSATYNYPTSTNALNQGALHCRISPVTTRALRPTPEINGTTLCYNASPIGQWAVSISDAFDTGSTAIPDDIQIDVYLSVLTLVTGA